MRLQQQSAGVPWAIRALEGRLVEAHLAAADDDSVTLTVLPGGATVTTFGSEVAQSGACCPSGSCCASGSCCQSYSACIALDDERGGDAAQDRYFTGAASTRAREKRLWPIPI